MRKIKKIIIHCSDSPHGRGDNAETVHRWHLEKGWDGIGYHFVILEDGTLENGRPIYWEGAHTRGFNQESIGVLMMGKKEFKDQQFETLKNLSITLKEKFGVLNRNIKGHYELCDYKTCPNFDVRKWVLNERL